MEQPHEIFEIKSDEDFERCAIDTFSYQYKSVSPYRKFCNLMGKHPGNVQRLKDIPFLPITFFKDYVISTCQEAEEVFTSSGTTGATPSKHYVCDLGWYRTSFTRGFELFYGSPEQYAILGLLPSYLERGDSSLVYMINDLISQSQHPSSGFYLNDLAALVKELDSLQQQGQKVLLIGVSFALLDLAEQYPMNLVNTIVMETGGMKGRRKEMVREELHQILQRGLGVEKIHSEYGMTELLSQAYSSGAGVFSCPPWMKLLIRDPEDALSLQKEGRTGGVNVVDLANRNSCSFIATQDLARAIGKNSWEILGRFDNSDIRGCNLMTF